jgi:pseudouridine kinase
MPATANIPSPVPYVVLLGGANMDITAQTPVNLVGADSTPGQIRCAPGGVARNIAENLARLGNVVHLVSAVGDDLFGQALLAATRQAGVRVDAVRCVVAARTATYLSVHGPDGDMSYAVNDMEVVHSITPAYLESHDALLLGAGRRVLDCNLDAAALEWVFAQDWKSPLFVDAVSTAKCAKILNYLHHIHCLKVNRLEAQVLTGLQVQDGQGALQAAVRLQVLGVQNVIVSLGEQGVAWRDAQGDAGLHVPKPRSVVNTSGAGDALLAGLVHAYGAGFSTALAVDFAVACAEITLSSTFANAPELSVAAVADHLRGTSA